jgi:hypothetical protein
MKIILSLFVYLAFSIFPAHAVYDYSSHFITRSFPIAMVLRNSFGSGVKFWGGSHKALYGYVRAGANIDTSVVVNTVGGQIDFFPISFLGFSAGSTRTYRNFDPIQFECDKVECRGDVKRNFVAAKMGLAYGPVYLMAHAERFQQELANPTGRQFADEQTSLIARAEGDEMERFSATLGYNLSDGYSLAGHFVNQEMLENKNISQMKLLLLRKQYGAWSYVAGAGLFRWKEDIDVATAIFSLMWDGSRGVKLF